MDDKLKALFKLLNQLDAMIDNYCQAIVDEEVRANAENSYKSGLKAKIIRTTDGHCCKWCNERAGIFEYPTVDNEVYRRHKNCGCTVDYVNERGKWQYVHTKRFLNNDEVQKLKYKLDIQTFGKPGAKRRDLYSDGWQKISERDMLKAFPQESKIFDDGGEKQYYYSNNGKYLILIDKTGGYVRFLDTRLNKYVTIDKETMEDLEKNGIINMHNKSEFNRLTHYLIKKKF